MRIFYRFPPCIFEKFVPTKPTEPIYFTHKIPGFTMPGWEKNVFYKLYLPDSFHNFRVFLCGAVFPV